MNFNKAVILGNLTRDPESKTLPSGQPVATFGVATNRFYTDKTGNKQKQAEFHNVVAFGKLADICSKYLKKGGLILVEGRIQTRSWEKDGVKHNRTEIIIENMQMGPKNSAGPSPSASSSFLKPKQSDASDDIPVIDQETPMSNSDEGVNVDDIPF
jgi:single-strand DNA-binding protein